ncbi:MAG TPA: hypothetical protein VHN99_05905, partial [Deinococcales bacterium]|nr:hypothetical protein [Deinococcales bacterium]
MSAFIPLVTYSSVTGFENCPKQMAFQAEAAPLPFQPAKLVGNAVHAAAEQAVKALRDGRKPTPGELDAALVAGARKVEPPMRPPEDENALDGV